MALNCMISLVDIGLEIGNDPPRVRCVAERKDWPSPCTAEHWDRVDEGIMGTQVKVITASGEVWGRVLEFNSRMGKIVVGYRDSDRKFWQLTSDFKPYDIDIPPTLH